MLCSDHDEDYRLFYRDVNGDLTGTRPVEFRSAYRTMDLEQILKRIEQRLLAVKLTANAASVAARKPDSIRNIRRAVKEGKRSGISTQTIAALAPVLETTPSWLLEGVDAPTDFVSEPRTQAHDNLAVDQNPPLRDYMNRGVPTNGQQRQLMPVYGAAEGGRGALILSKDPVEYREIPHYLQNTVDAYGVFVMGDSMSPRYEPGEVAEIAPYHPYRSGDDVILYRANGDGDERVCLKRLVSYNDEEWLVEQFNPPKKFKLSRAEWPICHVVRGRGPRT